ncbi:MAG: phosphatase PAP2 family protein [Schleiferiaceae bacterium]|nr:phosphatase PAP2 family protein [Schleiferiaceae bacterium]
MRTFKKIPNRNALLWVCGMLIFGLPQFGFCQGNDSTFKYSETLRWPSSRDWMRTGVALGTTGASVLLFQQYAKVPTSQDVAKIAGRHRYIGEQRKGYGALSDALLIGSVALPALYALTITTQQDRVDWAVGFGEALCYTFAINQLTKTIVTAPRPYVVTLDPAALDQRSGASFFSGHAAVAGAAASYFLFRFSDWGNSRHRGWWLAGAGVLATAAAGSRVVARNHFPEDVITGLAVGTTVSYLTYRLQRSNKTKVTAAPNALGGGHFSVVFEWQ